MSDSCQKAGFVRTGVNGFLPATGVRLSTVAPFTEKSRLALQPSPSMDCSEIRQFDASVEGAHLFFYVRLLSDRRFGQDFKKRKFLRTPSGRRRNVIFLGRPVNMSKSSPSRTHLDVSWAISDLGAPERDVFGHSEKMTISTLRMIRTPVYDNLLVRLKFIRARRHRWQGVLKFSAPLGTWLPDAVNKRLNFRRFQISNLSVTGVRLMAKHRPGTRGPGVRHSSVGCLRNNVG